LSLAPNLASIMLTEQKLLRVAEDAANRCEVSHATMQCPYGVIPGTNRCARHTGPLLAPMARQKEIETYQLGVFQERVRQFASDPKIKGLRDEIGILRLVLEQLFNKCNDAHDLLIASSKIGQIVSQIKDTVLAASKLEAALGQTIDKAQAMQLAESIIAVIVMHVEDPEILELIGRDIGDLVERAGIV